MHTAREACCHIGSAASSAISIGICDKLVSVAHSTPREPATSLDWGTSAPLSACDVTWHTQLESEKGSGSERKGLPMNPPERTSLGWGNNKVETTTSQGFSKFQYGQGSNRLGSSVHNPAPTSPKTARWQPGDLIRLVVIVGLVSVLVIAVLVSNPVVPTLVGILGVVVPTAFGVQHKPSD